MNVLVTGGTGFLGKALARRLNLLGYHVTVIGRNESIGSQLEGEGITFIKADLEDEKAILNVCMGQSYVFHCGALSSPWGKYEEFYLANVIGTRNIIKGCREANINRLIHVSTPSIYFYYDDRLDVKETDSLPKRFVNDYAATKFLAEQEIDKAYETGLPVITIRPRALFGPEDTTILPRLIRTNEKRFVPFIDNGNVLMDITYVENVVDALLLCMKSAEDTLGRKYNITNGETVVFKDILHTLFNELGKPLRKKEISYKKAMGFAGFLEWFSKFFMLGKEPILTKYTVSVLGKSQTLNIDAAKKDLGYEPSVSIKEGIGYFVEWWKRVEEGK